MCSTTLGSPTACQKRVYGPKLPTFGWCVGGVVRVHVAVPGGVAGWVIPGSATPPTPDLWSSGARFAGWLLDPPRSKGACLGPGPRKAEHGQGGEPGFTDRARRVVHAQRPPRPVFQSKPGANGQTARFQVNSTKLSQNGRVSPKSVHEAWHTPCFQNGPQKSPLDISRFPFSLAFSHKELMGHF